VDDSNTTQGQEGLAHEDPVHDGVAPPETFLEWAMEGRFQARAVTILPVVVGAGLAILGTLFHFGEHVPLLMWSIPWDLTANYRCVVLPGNVVLYCLVLVPLASALILMTQPRLRSSADGLPRSRNAPEIDAGTWVVAAVGLLLVATLAPAFELFGAGWTFACRIQDLYGMGGRIALAAMLVLVSPAATIAALTLAYCYRRRFPMTAATPAAVKALKPVGTVLMTAGLVCIGYAAWTVHSDPVNAGITAIAFGAAGFLITKGSLGAARFMGWWNAVGIVGGLSAVVTVPLNLPLTLIEAKFHVAPVATAFETAILLASFALALWIYQAVRAPAVLSARRAAELTVAHPWTAFALGVLLVAYQVFMMVQMQNSAIAEEAIRRARTKYGSQYAFQVAGYSSSGRKHVFVTLLGYTATEIIDADVDWER